MFNLVEIRIVYAHTLPVGLPGTISNTFKYIPIRITLDITAVSNTKLF